MSEDNDFFIYYILFFFLVVAAENPGEHPLPEEPKHLILVGATFDCWFHPLPKLGSVSQEGCAVTLLEKLAGCITASWLGGRTA